MILLDIKYIPSSSILLQGIKGNKQHKYDSGYNNGHRYFGSNGSYNEYTPPQVIAYYTDNSGNIYSENIYYYIKNNSNRKITQNYINIILRNNINRDINNWNDLILS